MKSSEERLTPSTLRFCGSTANALMIAQLKTKIAGPPVEMKKNKTNFQIATSIQAINYERVQWFAELKRRSLN